MFLNRKASRILVIRGLALALLASLSEAQDRRILEAQIPLPVANGARRAGRYSGAARLNVAIGLPLTDKEGLRAFIDALYDPSSPTYKSYLTPDQFTTRFGASTADYQKVVDFLKSSGLTVTATTPNRMIVDVTGLVSDFERVFQFKMRTYQHPSEPRQFHAPDVEPSVPLDIPILDIIGLDNYMPPRRMDAKAERADAVHSDITGSGPNGSFQAKDLRAAYVPGVTLTGTGQSIGLFEIGPYDPNDIAIFEQAVGLSNISIVNVLLDGVNGAYAPFYGDGEITLDIEMAMSLAPGAQILVYEGTLFVDVINRMATDNAAKQMSSSWAFGGYPSTMEQILMEYAAQGQTFFECSLDNGAYPPSAQIFAPIGDPYVTVVGGTSLVTTGPGGAWLSESAWKGSGGGFNSLYSIPSWQSPVSMVTNLGSTRYRNFPDVAMVGDTILFAVSGGRMSSGTGGTSASTPLWAAFLALANQQAAMNQKPSVGFLNPTLYALAQSSRYNLDLHDITVGNDTNAASPNQYYAVPGFDLTTGWGSPTGQNLMNDLTSGNAATPGFSLSVAPYQITVNPGGTGTTSVTLNSYGGFAGPVNLTVAGFPSGVTASFSPSSTASSSTLTLTVPASVAVGYYPATITATSGAAAKQTIAMNLTVLAPIMPDFTISASPSILDVAQGASLQSAITITPVGTFASPVSLSVTGAPQGVTASFSPASTAASSTLTLSVGSQVAAGIHILNIAASAGSLNHVSTIALVIPASATPPVPVDLSTSYNLTGISADGVPYLVGLSTCCSYSANLLGTSLVSQNVPFVFGPASNGIAPPWNAISGGGVTVPLPAGQFGSVRILAAASNGNETALAFVATYSDKSTDTFTQNVSDWNTPRNYPGETTVATMAYSNQLSGGKVAGSTSLYSYPFTLDVCKTATSLMLPKSANLNTLAITMVPPATACTVTTIDSVNVVSGASNISENAWIEIHGFNLAPSNVPLGGMTWSSAPEFAQGKMPTQLDGVSVTVNGNPAYVYYISQNQIDVLAPLDTKTGTVPVVVTTGTAVSAAFSVDKVALSPAFALSGGSKYLAATHANGTYVGPSTEGPLFTAAAPGEEIVLYGFGFGLPNGASLVGGSSTQSGSLPFLPTIQIGGKAAQVAFAGLISPGLYQFNVVVPSTAPSGDNAVTAVYNKVSISTAGFVPIN